MSHNLLQQAILQLYRTEYRIDNQPVSISHDQQLRTLKRKFVIEKRDLNSALKQNGAALNGIYHSHALFNICIIDYYL